LEVFRKLQKTKRILVVSKYEYCTTSKFYSIARIRTQTSLYITRRLDFTDGALVDLIEGALVDLIEGALVDVIEGAFVDLTEGTFAAPLVLSSRPPSVSSI
jgi:hypothetical protein